MRYSAALTTTLCGTALLLGQVFADVEDVVSSASSGAEEIVSSASASIESVTSSAVEKPTFTVSGELSLSYGEALHDEHLLTPNHSPRSFKRRSSSSSLTTGLIGGSLLTQRRKTRRRTRIGHSWANGLLRSLQSSRVLRATKVL